MRYIVMNNFWIEPSCEDEFERAFDEGNKHVVYYEGLLDFDLLKGGFCTETQTFHYISYTVWRSEKVFEEWKTSESFQLSHAYKLPEGTIVRVESEAFSSTRFPG